MALQKRIDRIEQEMRRRGRADVSARELKLTGRFMLRLNEMTAADLQALASDPTIIDASGRDDVLWMLGFDLVPTPDELSSFLSEVRHDR